MVKCKFFTSESKLTVKVELTLCGYYTYQLFGETNILDVQ